MFSKLVLTDEERVVDPQLGYPHGYAKLCRHAAVQLQGLLTPFTEGPPQRFLPYSPQTEDFAKLKEWDSLFPVVAETERDPPNARKYAEELWQHLDHLGNAGFDPAKFRVDSYGNVVYWNADPSSPLAWEIDHWFPHSRGGRTVLSNLRVVQWQANQRKKNRLEFLVPWWDLQHGCSINQFLSAFASKNADFRKRSFALFFSGGEDESVAREHVGECRPWPQQFREKKALCGLAAAAIVTVPKDNDENHGTHITSKAVVNADVVSVPVSVGPGTPARRRWSSDEEEALRRAVNKFGPGNWKEIKEHEPALANRSTVQIKDKFRLMRGDWQNSGKENIVTAPTTNGRGDHLDRQSAATTALQKELRVKIMREEEKREKEEEIAELEETVMKLKQQNEKERLTSLELEAVLTKHKQRVEKQRRWAETQSSYRLCLERMIRDTMHQSISYKEQARLNQAACNALMARLDCQKATCEAAEKDLLQRYSQRGILEVSVNDEPIHHTNVTPKRSATKGQDIVDVSSCVSLLAADEDGKEEEEKVVLPGDDLIESESEDETADKVYNLRREHRQSKDLLHQLQKQQSGRKSPDKQVIKIAMQVEDTKDAVEALELLKVPVEVKSPGRSKDSEVLTDTPQKAKDGVTTLSDKQLDVDIEMSGSEGESDFADDEMSNELHRSQDMYPYDPTEMIKTSEVDEEVTSKAKLAGAQRTGTVGTKGAENKMDVVLVGYEYAQPPVPEPADDPPVPSAGEARPNPKQEVQKNVIMVQTENPKQNTASEIIDSAALYKQEYLDELLQQVRFQIPTMEAAEVPMEDGLLCKSEEHLDELLQQVLTTHLDRIRRNEAATQQTSDTDDEKVWQIGKSNLDKWLQVLLFKDVESGGSSPAQDSPLHRAFSPALSQISIAAMRGSMELEKELVKKDGDNLERPKGLWGGLLRKLSVKHQSEQSLSNKLDEESDIENDDLKPRHSNHDVGVTEVLNSLNQISLGNEATCCPTSEDQRLGTEVHEIPESVKNWPEGSFKKQPGTAPVHRHKENVVMEEVPLGSDTTGIWKAEHRVEDGVPGYVIDQHFSIEKRYFPRSLSDVDEISETESLNSNNTSDFRLLESRDANKTGLRASIKAAGLVWKKAVKKLENRLQEGPAPPPNSE